MRLLHQPKRLIQRLRLRLRAHLELREALGQDVEQIAQGAVLELQLLRCLPAADGPVAGAGRGRRLRRFARVDELGVVVRFLGVGEGGEAFGGLALCAREDGGVGGCVTGGGDDVEAFVLGGVAAFGLQGAEGGAGEGAGVFWVVG